MNKEDMTTISITKELRNRIAKLGHKTQSYDEILESICPKLAK